MRRMAIRMQSTAAASAEELGKTFKFQSTLPHLPVPPLKATAQKYLRTVKPLVLPSAYEKTERAVAEFIKSGGQGEELQKRLEARAADPKIKNWIYDWWNEAAYMSYRDPVVPYVSYFFSHNDDPTRFGGRPAKRAAYIATAALNFKFELDNRTLEPDAMRKQPIDMDLFRFLFHNCRLPAPGVDTNAAYPVKGNEYFVVVRRNRYYRVPYLIPDGSRVLTTAEFEYAIEQIYGDADLKGTSANVGILTSENRDTWTEVRARLLAGNEETLETIQAAAFVICLDQGAPLEPNEKVAQYWHGNGRNRWYDKPAQFIVCDNATAGFMGEHSMMDGTQTLRLNESVCSQIVNGKIDAEGSVGVKITPKEVSFTLNEALIHDIDAAEKQFRSQIDQHEVAVWIFRDYGKNLIKQFNCSPDAYIQMLLQLAYFKMNGVLRGVYESATTRKYILGRTETTRSVSVESLDFVRTFVNPLADSASKIATFRKAVDSQVRYVAEATEGFGVDRHLFGLKKLLKAGEPLPEIYKDPAFAYSSSWYISSSQLSSEFLDGYGWSQVIDEGFGCAYMIKSDSIQINICSKKLGSSRFSDYLEESARELAELLSADVKPKL